MTQAQFSACPACDACGRSRTKFFRKAGVKRSLPQHTRLEEALPLTFLPAGGDTGFRQRSNIAMLKKPEAGFANTSLILFKFRLALHQGFAPRFPDPPQTCFFRKMVSGTCS
jgi:hypothetical protein